MTLDDIIASLPARERRGPAKVTIRIADRCGDGTVRYDMVATDFRTKRGLMICLGDFVRGIEPARKRVRLHCPPPKKVGTRWAGSAVLWLRAASPCADPPRGLPASKTTPAARRRIALRATAT